jgi:hypothetical protein
VKKLITWPSRQSDLAGGEENTTAPDKPKAPIRCVVLL